MAAQTAVRDRAIEDRCCKDAWRTGPDLLRNAAYQPVSEDELT